MWSAPSDPDCFDALKEGAAYCKISLTSAFPVELAIPEISKISIGTAVSTAVRLGLQVPTNIISLSDVPSVSLTLISV